ncbi:unnamed protein product [Gordionus sp. m RMFG-2023]
MLEHHKKSELCETRPPYRAAKKLKAVKVYNISSESQYLIVQNIPDLSLESYLLKLFTKYGKIVECRNLRDYPSEKFITTFLIKYGDFHQAKLAKSKLDDYSFFGSIIHICYSPEYENVQETIAKLNMRLHDVTSRLRDYGKYKDK